MEDSPMWTVLILAGSVPISLKPQPASWSR